MQWIEPFLVLLPFHFRTTDIKPTLSLWSTCLLMYSLRDNRPQLKFWSTWTQFWTHMGKTTTFLAPGLILTQPSSEHCGYLGSKPGDGNLSPLSPLCTFFSSLWNIGFQISKKKKKIFYKRRIKKIASKPFDLTLVQVLSTQVPFGCIVCLS